MPKRTRNYDEWLYEQLMEPATAATYLNAAAEDSPDLLLIAMRNVAEAHKMARVATGANVSRESLYRTLSKNGNPKLDTFASILDVFGLKLAVSPKDRPAGKSQRTRKRRSAPSPRRVAVGGRRT